MTLSQMKFSFADQLKYEAEGAAAAIENDKGRDECPYEERSPQWHHWVYGNDQARGEQQIIAAGKITFYSTDVNSIGTVVSLEDAIRFGWWKPRWAKIPRFISTGICTSTALPCSTSTGRGPVTTSVPQVRPTTIGKSE